MLPLRFVPYDDLDGTANVVVDGAAAPNTRLTLSHWPGSPTPVELRDDLSAQIAFRALERPEVLDGIDVVSNNHFDQDGLASVFALVEPEAALARRDRVIDVARAGDFGGFADRDSARVAIAIAAYENTSPLTGSYPEIVAALYGELLPRFTEWLDDPSRARSLWEAEDAHLGESMDAIARGVVAIEEVPELDLAVVTVPDDWSARATHRFTQQWTEAVHPMAVNHATDRLRILLVQGHRYRLELRYESWVMFVSHAVLPRPDLAPLAAALTTSETKDATWEADPPGALTPQLRLAGGDESALTREQVRRRVEAFLADAPTAWDPFAPRS